jgi:uncharacterized protein
MNLTLILLAQTYTFFRLAPDAEIPNSVLLAPYFSITKTEDELSIILPDPFFINDAIEQEGGWMAFRVEGQLAFSLTGIMAELTGVLAAVGISIFALSTYKTDYIFVKKEKVEMAKRALSAAGCYVTNQ